MDRSTVARLTLFGSMLFAGVYLVNVLYDRALGDFPDVVPIGIDPLGPQALVVVLLVMSALFATTIVLRTEERT